MKNIFLLPTDKESRLACSEYVTNVQGIDKKTFKLKLWDKFIPNKELKDVGYIPQHIYITSDEVIKEGDWFIDLELSDIKQCTDVYKNGLPISNHIVYSNLSDIKKIILTTDEQLIADGVQAIYDNFLEWFVKNPSCESVKIESWQTKGEWDLDYKIIIPQEEPICWDCQGAISKEGICFCNKEETKQETLNEYDASKLYPKETLEQASENYGKEVLAKRKSNKNLTLDEKIWLCGGGITGFIDGAKFQQEQQDDFIIKFLEFIEGSYSYSNIFDHWYSHGDTSKTYTKKELLEHFKKNKI
jgi:hypothetical protein